VTGKSRPGLGAPWRLGSVLALAVLSALFLHSRAAAEHFYVLLRLTGPEGQVEASMDTTPPIGGVNPRPVLKAKPGEPLQILWTMRSGYPHGVMKGVTIRFFVVQEEQLGQKPVPKRDNAVVENAFVMDFSPTSSASGALRFRAPDPGNYLVRVQSEGTMGEVHDHEHFSALDLAVSQ
jgi:hypothetical protein